VSDVSLLICAMDGSELTSVCCIVVNNLYYVVMRYMHLKNQICVGGILMMIVDGNDTVRQ
jgi:hypothetical protein